MRLPWTVLRGSLKVSLLIGPGEIRLQSMSSPCSYSAYFMGAADDPADSMRPHQDRNSATCGYVRITGPKVLFGTARVLLVPSEIGL